MNTKTTTPCLATLLALCAACLLLGQLDGSAPRAEEPKQPAPATLDALVSGKLRIVDLGYGLSEKTAYWPGPNYEPFRLRTIATLERDGVLSKAFSSPEHLAAHLDAPNHFERGQPSVDQIPPSELFCAGVLIDVSERAKGNPDYELSPADVRAWEGEHGPIVEGSAVLLQTGWARFWGNAVRYQNKDDQGRFHFPGYSREAAELLINERRVRGIGIDTLSIDPGTSRDFAVHHIVNRHGHWGLENLARLEQLPPRGFYLVVAPMKIETGSGAPSRVFAIVP